MTTDDGPGTGTGGTTGAGGDAGAGGQCGACLAHETCAAAGLCVAASVTVPGFAIDATEVTRGQYAAWLATEPPTGAQPAACGWNASFAPDPTCLAAPSVCQGPGCATHPQVCVDLCDASAYCGAVGKRLCGGLGGGPVTGLDDPTQSRWFAACSSGGAYEFTYGPGPDATKCNDFLASQPTTVPVASKTGCQSPVPAYAGVFDLIGNAEEWEDNCSTSAGASDICHPRGLSFGMGAAMPLCASSTYAARDEARDTIGFRCCAP